MDPIFFEKLLIKFLFINEMVRERVLPFLKPEIFDDKKNLTIVKDIIEFNYRFEKFPTVPELKIDMKDEGAFNQLLELMDVDVSEYSTEFLLEEIEEFFRKKLINNVNTEVAMALINDKMEDIKQFPDKLRESIAFSFNTKIGLDILDEEEMLYNSLRERDYVLSSGLRDLDKVIEGGFHEKSLSLFMAETNMGKSLIMGSLAVNSLLMNKNVLYITCEMSEKKISERVMANMFDVNMEDLKMLTRDKFHEKFEKVRKKIDHKFIVKEFPTKSINANHIRNVLKELETKKKFKPDIVYIDYIGIMLPIFKSKSDNTYNEVKRISEEVRGLAVETGFPIVSAVQANRSGFGAAEMSLTNMSDSIGPAATADVIIAVTQTEEFRKAGKYSWQLSKNRYGLNKKKLTVNVDYYKMRVYDTDESEITDGADQITKDPPNSKDKISKVNNAVNDVKNVIKKDAKDKFNKMIDFE
jgi:replicative DNA helicase